MQPVPGGGYEKSAIQRYFECYTCGKECRVDVMTECKRCGAHYRISDDPSGVMLMLAPGISEFDNG
jgi:hypothetical protein